jgi:hypothetical protein
MCELTIATKRLDTLREKGGVNVLMATVFTYGTDLAFRRVHGEPLPDHGVQEYDRVHGGSFTKGILSFTTTRSSRTSAPRSLASSTSFADVIPKAKAKGMQTYALFEEAYNPRLIANFEKVCEVDVYGKLGRSTCLNNLQACTFISSMVSDWITEAKALSVRARPQIDESIATEMLSAEGERVRLCHRQPIGSAVLQANSSWLT